MLSRISRSDYSATRRSFEILPKSFSAHDHFARDAAGRLFRYDGGVYTENAELYVKRQVKELTVKFGNPGRWNRTLAHEVIEYISLDAPELLERPDLDRINLMNGILDVRTGELAPHSPAFLSSVRIPINYDRDRELPGD